MNLPAEQQRTLDRALNCHSNGNLDEAEKLYQAVLAEDPEQADALHYLGVINLQLGRFDEAVRLIQRAVDARPDYTDAVINLGYGLNALGRNEDAAGQFERALAMGPPTAQLLANLGGALEQLGRYADAATRFEEALKLQPGLAEARRSLADVLLKLNRPVDALREIKKAVADGMPSIPMQVSLGNILLAAGRPGDAIRCFNQVLKEQPDLAPVHRNLAKSLRHMGRFSEAIEHYKKLLAKDPDNVVGHHELGVVYQDLGDNDSALATFRNAVRLDPNCVIAWHGIATVSKNDIDENEVKALLDLQQAPETSTNDRLRLGFALGKHYENIGQHDEAAKQFLLANKLKRAEFEYDIDSDLRAVENLRSCFDKAFLDRWSNTGLPDRTPIFIVGMPRSGTTLIEQILANHPRVFGAGESTSLVHSIIETFPISDGVDYTCSINDPTSGDFKAIARRYLDCLPEADEEYITDKLPHNFLNVGMIRILFPNATIVHCRRDPRDTCFSIYKNLIGADSHFYAYDLEELARYYNGYAALMNHWDQVMPGAIHTIEYEQMIDNQEQSTRELLDACGLEWDPACLEFHKLERPILTISAPQVRQPLYRGSIGAWRPYEKMLEPLLDILDQANSGNLH
jgi:tetratricopeptide (TPR) repeat protein